MYLPIKLKFTMYVNYNIVTHYLHNPLQVQATQAAGTSEEFYQSTSAPQFTFTGSYINGKSNSNYGYSNQVTDMDVEDLGTTRKVPPTELPKVTMESIMKRLRDR